MSQVCHSDVSEAAIKTSAKGQDPWMGHAGPFKRWQPCGLWNVLFIPNCLSPDWAEAASGRMCEKFHQLLAVGRWFPPGTPVSSTRKLI